MKEPIELYKNKAYVSIIIDVLSYPSETHVYARLKGQRRQEAEIAFLDRGYVRIESSEGTGLYKCYPDKNTMMEELREILEGFHNKMSFLILSAKEFDRDGRMTRCEHWRYKIDKEKLEKMIRLL